MSYTICMWRGSSFSMRLTGHFSSASGSTVWLVNANTYKRSKVADIQLAYNLKICRKSSFSHLKLPILVVVAYSYVYHKLPTSS